MKHHIASYFSLKKVFRQINSCLHSQIANAL